MSKKRVRFAYSSDSERYCAIPLLIPLLTPPPLFESTDACPRFSVQSFEPQVEGSSSDIIVSVCLPPEGPTEMCFEADTWNLRSSPPQSSRRVSFHSAISSFANPDGISDRLQYPGPYNLSKTSISSRSARLNFRIGNGSNRRSGDKLSFSSRQTFETAHEPPPELLLALRLLDPTISPLPPLPRSDELRPNVSKPLGISRNEGPSPEEEYSGNLTTSPQYNISFIRDVSNVCIIGSEVNFTTNIMHVDDNVCVGLHTLYLRSDPNALHNSYERQKWINQQTKKMRAWGSQLVIGSSFTPGEYSLSVPSIKTRDLEEVVKDMFTWLYSASSPSIMWLHEAYEGNLRTSLIGQCLANFLGDRGDLTASYFYMKRSPISPAGNSHSRTQHGMDNPCSIIPTIAYGLARRIPEIETPIALTAAKDLCIFDLCPDEQMKKLIVDPLQEASNIVKGNTYKFPRLFLIHGLEDCNDDDFQELFLCAFGKSLTLLQQSIPQKLMLLGRHTAHIRECFSRPELKKIVRRRPLPVTQDEMI